MNRHMILITSLLLAALLSAGCSDPQESTATTKTPHVYTTFYPATYFTQRIAGDHATVTCPLPGEADPIFWMPDDDALNGYQKADLIIINGAGFEKWIDKVSLPTSKIIETAAPLSGELITFAKALTHSHAGQGSHSHEGRDGHTWLDPHNAKVQANEIRNALARLMPDRADEFHANYAALAADLDALDAALRELSKVIGKRPMLASHAAYNYLARRYAWDIESLALDPGEMPPDSVLNEIRLALQDRPAKIILWESDPTPEIAAKLKNDLDLTSVVFSPCETPDAAGPDYLARMKNNIARLTKAIAP